MAESEDEFELINEVKILAVKIDQAGFKFDAQQNEEIHKRMKAHESLDVRVKKWKSRVASLQRFLDVSLQGISGGPPGASVVAASCAPSLAQAIRSKSDKNSPSLSYVLGEGNEAPVMCATHVKLSK